MCMYKIVPQYLQSQRRELAEPCRDFVQHLRHRLLMREQVFSVLVMCADGRNFKRVEPRQGGQLESLQ